MKKRSFHFLLIFIALLSCKKKQDLIIKVSNDSLYIEKDISWKVHDIFKQEFIKNKNYMLGYSKAELLKFDQNQLLFISTSVLKTADDTIHLNWPVEYGGEILIAKISEGQVVKSNTNINDKKIIWLSGNVVKFNNKTFQKLDKSSPNHLKNILENWTSTEGTDHLFITHASP